MVNFLRPPTQNQMVQQPRSALVAALLQQAQQNQGRPSYSLAGSLNIAAPQILASLLAKKNAQEDQRKLMAQRAALSQALGVPPVSPVMSETAPPWTDEQKRRAALVNSLGPEGVQAAQGALLQQTLMPKGQEPYTLAPGETRFDAANRPIATGSPKTKEPLTSIGKINADVEAGNISPEVGQSLAQAQLSQDAKSIGEAETALRKEFNQGLTGVTTALLSLSNARSLLETGNAIGAQAALTSFIRAIDNSVVRPSEMEQYQGISGVARGLENRLSLLMGQGPFGAETKKDLISSIDALSKSAEDIRKGAINYYGELAISSRLNPKHVTGFNFGPGQSFNPKAPVQNVIPHPTGEPERHIP